MVNFGQSVEITFVGMSIVFIVLSLLALLLKIQGMILAPEEGKQVKKESEKEVITKKTSLSNPRMKAAISAALAAYNEELDRDDKED